MIGTFIFWFLIGPLMFWFLSCSDFLLGPLILISDWVLFCSAFWLDAAVWKRQPLLCVSLSALGPGRRPRKGPFCFRLVSGVFVSVFGGCHFRLLLLSNSRFVCHFRLLLLSNSRFVRGFVFFFCLLCVLFWPWGWLCCCIESSGGVVPVVFLLCSVFRSHDFFLYSHRWRHETLLKRSLFISRLSCIRISDVLKRFLKRSHSTSWNHFWNAFWNGRFAIYCPQAGSAAGVDFIH